MSTECKAQLLDGPVTSADHHRVTSVLFATALGIVTMKQVQDEPVLVKVAPKDVKTSQASARFVDLFRRIAVHDHKETS